MKFDNLLREESQLTDKELTKGERGVNPFDGPDPIRFVVVAYWPVKHVNQLSSGSSEVDHKSLSKILSIIL